MRTDFLLDNDLDLLIENGDFSTGKSDAQHGRLLLSAWKGDFSQYPQTGVGMVQYLKGVFDVNARYNIRLQFEGDGYKVKKMDFEPQTGNLMIDFN
jgi:hypothetical protein